MYIVAGEVVARISGMHWEEFVEKRIMQPLNMSKSAAAFSRIKDRSDIIDPHAPVNGKVQVIDRLFNFNEVGDAAGGIYSSISDMSKWVMMQLNNGKFGENGDHRLFSEEVHKAMWTPYTMIPVNAASEYKTHFSGYGLGWRMADVKGYLQVGHTGGLAGIVTQVTLFPELKLGIIVFTNQQSTSAFSAITNTIKDRYLGVQGIDRVKQYREADLKTLANAEKITGGIWKFIEEIQNKAGVRPDNSLYSGTYSDNWFGDVTIWEKNGKLWFDSKRSPKLTGEMLPYKGNTFIVKWVDRSMDADAFVMFTLDTSGKANGMKMKPISPLTDFSYDFQDLDFTRKQ
jgi:CubicO group peptidase (beta-lactamase class C family)